MTATALRPGRSVRQGEEPALESADTGRRWVPSLGQSRLLVAGVVAVLATPYLLRGPVLLADDYIWLRNARFGGWLAAGGPRTYGRPGAMLGCDITFGLIGPHPLALYAVQVGLWLAAALAVLGLLRRLLPARCALLVTAVWLVLPDHASLERWLSTSQAWVALALLAFGASLIIDGTRRDRLPVAGIVLVAASISFYEVTAGAALAAVVVLPWAITRRPQWRTAIVGAGAIAVPVLWSLVAMSAYPSGIAGRLQPQWVVHGPWSLGVAPWTPAGRATALCLCVIVVAATLLGFRGGRWHADRHQTMIVIGAALVGLALVPQVKLNTNFYGMLDRSNTVAAVGIALVVVGSASWIVARLGNSPVRLGAIAVSAAALLAGSFAVRVGWDAEYRHAGVLADRATTQLVAQRGSAPGAGPILVRQPVAMTQRILGLADGWNASAALQLRTGDPHAVVWVVQGCQGSGPPVSDPRATYGAVALSQPVPGCQPGKVLSPR